VLVDSFETQIITDKQGEVIAIEPGYPGPASGCTSRAQRRGSIRRRPVVQPWLTSVPI